MALSWDRIKYEKLAAFVQDNFEGDFRSWKREDYVKFMEESGLPPSVFYSNGSGPPSADDSKGIVSQRKSTVEVLIEQLNKTKSMVRKLATKMDDLYTEQDEQKSKKNTSKLKGIGLNVASCAAGVTSLALPPTAPFLVPLGVAVGVAGAKISIDAELVDKEAAQRYKKDAQKILADYRADWEKLTSILKNHQESVEYLKSTTDVPTYMALFVALATPYEVELTPEFFRGLQRSLANRDGGLSFFDGPSSSGSRVAMEARNLRKSLKSLEATLLPDNFSSTLSEVSGLLNGVVAGVGGMVTAGMVAAVAEGADELVTVAKGAVNVAQKVGVTAAKVAGAVGVVVSILAIVADVVILVRDWNTSATMESARKIRNHFLERVHDLDILLADLRVVRDRIYLSQRPLPT